MMRYKDDSTYEGYWKDDRWNGQGPSPPHPPLPISHSSGVLVSSVGVYTGDFFRGKKEGKGEMVFTDVVRFSSLILAFGFPLTLS